MRATVTIEKDILDELNKETKARSKVTAVRQAVQEYLKKTHGLRQGNFPSI